VSANSDVPLPHMLESITTPRVLQIRGRRVGYADL
jgi:hypothetical protein